MGEPGPFFFKTRKAVSKESDDFRLVGRGARDVCRADLLRALQLPGQALVDGGVFANNPAMCALAEVMRFQPTADIALLSLGTGQRTRKRTFDDVDHWGLLAWARPILDAVFDGVSDAVHYQLRHPGARTATGAPGRAQDANDDLDDASEEQPAGAARCSSRGPL